MSRSALIWLYGAVIILLVVGIELMYKSVAAEAGINVQVYSEFQISQLMYVAATLILVRLICKRYYTKDNWLYLTIALVCMIPAFIGIRYVLEEVIWKILFNRSNYNDETTIPFYIADNLGYAVYYIIVGIMLYAIDHMITQQRRVMQLEAEQKETALLALNAQFNPHFLFNSLNNIYALIQTNTFAASEALIQLSGLTRFLTEQKSPLIALKTERNQCEHYLRLQALRFTKPVQIFWDIDDNIGAALIPTFTLLGCLENAYKHGDLHIANRPLRISVHRKNDRLHIEVENVIGAQQKDAGSGIGLANLEKRLALLFPDNHQFYARKILDKFIVEIDLPYAT